MDRIAERKGRGAILQLTKRRLVEIGYSATSPSRFTRTDNNSTYVIELQKKRSGPQFRVWCKRGMPNDEKLKLGPHSDPFETPNSPNGRKYNLGYHLSPDTYKRCSDEICAFVEEVAEPWFRSWK